MKRKWQRVLSWILTLTMLLGTFEGTGIGTIKANAATPTEAEIVSIEANLTANNFKAKVSFKYEAGHADHWGVKVLDEMGKAAYILSTSAAEGEADLTFAVGNIVYGPEVTANDPFRWDGFLTVQAFAFDGAVENDDARFIQQVNGTLIGDDAITFVPENDNAGKRIKLNAGDIYIVETLNQTAYTGGNSDSVISMPLGNGSIEPRNYVARRAGADTSIFDNVKWTLVSGDYDNDGKFVADGVYSAEENGKLNGVDLVKNADGSLTISGTPDETLTDDYDDFVLFNLIAENKGWQGDELQSARYGRYNMFIYFAPLDDATHGHNPLKVKYVHYYGTEKIESDGFLTPVDYLPAQPAVNDYYKNRAVMSPYKNITFNDVTGKAAYVLANNDPDLGAVDEITEFDGYFIAKAGYKVSDELAANTVKPSEITLQNTSTLMDLTDIDIYLEDDGIYTYNEGKWEIAEINEDTITKDKLKFALTGNKEITSLKKNAQEQKSFKVAPIEGLEAIADDNGAAVLYKSAVWMKAKELPVNGIKIADLVFLVNPSNTYTLKVGDEGAKEILFDADGCLDLGTYTAANDIPTLELNVSSDEGSVIFIDHEPAAYTRLPGYNAGKENTIQISGLAERESTVVISGSLKPETYQGVAIDFMDSTIDSCTKAKLAYAAGKKGPIYYINNTTVGSVYLIPLKVQDSNNNVEDFYGKLTVKAAEVTVVDEETTNVLKSADKVSWHGAEDLDEQVNTANLYQTVISITNPNKQTLYLNATLGGADAAAFIVPGEDDEDLYTDVDGVKYIVLAKDATKEITVGNADDLVKGVYNATLTFSGEGIDDFVINLEYEALDADTFRIIAPKGEIDKTVTPNVDTEAAENAGTLIEKAKILNIGLGDRKYWQFDTIGQVNKTVTYRLADIDDEIAYDGGAGAKHKVTNKKNNGTGAEVGALISNNNNDGTGIGEWGFSFTQGGLLTTQGPRKKGDFYICVEAKYVSNAALLEDANEDNDVNAYTYAYTYYHINIGDSTEAITVTTLDDDTDEHEKLLKANDTDITAGNAANFAGVSDARNMVIETTASSREPIAKVVTIKNNTTTAIKNLKVSYKTLKGIAPYFGRTVDTDFYNFETDPDEDPIFAVDLARNKTLDIPVKFVAPGAYPVPAGTYMQRITVSADGVAPVVFYVKVTVKASPTIDDFVQSNDYHKNKGVDGYVDYDRDESATLPYYDAEYTNVIAGNKVVVGQEITGDAITLSAKKSDGTPLNPPYASYSWAPRTAADPSIQGQFVLSNDGKITGKATKPGTYHMTITVTDLTDPEKPEYGYKDICVIVPGSIIPEITTSGVDVTTNAYTNDGYWIFNGVVQGEAAPARKVFTIRNTDAEKAITDLKISVKDFSDKYAGSSDHYNVICDADHIDAGLTESITFTVVPRDTSTVGDFVAVIVVEALQVAPIEIPVTFSVVEPIKLTPPTDDQTLRTVGKAFELELEGEGGHKNQTTRVWSAIMPTDNADDDKLNEFVARMAELSVGTLNAVVDHASVIVNGKLTTRKTEVDPGRLTGAGNYSFTASFNIAAKNIKKDAKGNIISIQYPEQYATEDITLNFLPTEDAFIISDYAERNIGTEEKPEMKVIPVDDVNLDIGRSTHTIVDEHGTDPVIGEYAKMTSFTFRTQAPGYAVEEGQNQLLTKSFIVVNALDAFGENGLGLAKYEDEQGDIYVPNPKYLNLKVSANLIAADGTASKDFEFVGGYKAGDIFEIGVDNERIAVRPVRKLPVGTYTADLVISGTGIADIVLPLSFTVEDLTYRIAYSVDKEASVSVNAFAIAPIKEGTAHDVANGDATIYIYATGNQPIVINRIVELKPDGTVYPSDDAPGKKFTTFNVHKKGSNADAFKFMDKNYAIAPATDVTAPSYLKDDYVAFNLDVKDHETLSDNTAKIRIYYRNGESNIAQTSVDVEVSYVVYEKENNKIVYTPSDSVIALDKIALDKGEEVLEGYKASDYAQFFKVANTETGDKSKGLYGLDVTVDNFNEFEVDDKAAVSVKVIYAGDEKQFKVEPVDGLSWGSYDARITFHANNQKKDVIKTVTFIVGSNVSFNSAVYKRDTIINKGFKDRIFDTLDQMKANQKADTGYAIQTVAKTVFTGIDEDDTIKDATSAIYLINVNDIKKKTEWVSTINNDWSSFDVMIYKTANDVIIRKAINPAGKVTTDVGKATYTLANPKGDGENKFTALNLTIMETVTYKKAKDAKGFKTYDIPWGKTIADAEGFKPEDIIIEDKERALDGYVDEDTSVPVETDEPIYDDHNLVPLWHTHVYASDELTKVVSGNVPGVEWTWIGNEKDGYTKAYVTLTCISDKCKDAKKGAVSINGIISEELMPESCTEGGYIHYSAIAYYNKNEVSYVSDINGKIQENGCGHNWSFDWDNVKWYTDDPNAVSCNVVKTCESISHNVLRHDGPKTINVSTNNIVYVGIGATCTEPGSGYYIATFEDPDIPAADISASRNVVSINVPNVPATGHKWSVSSCTMEGTFEEGPTSAVMYLVCENDPTHTASENITKDNIMLVSENAVSKTWRAQCIKDMQSLTAEFTFYNHSEHTYSVSWNWTELSATAAAAKAIFTCTVGGEITVVDAAISKVESTETITWTATAQDPNGEIHTDVKIVDRATGEEVIHKDHVWSAPVWDWTGTTTKSAIASATFTCTASANAIHSVTLQATIKDERDDTVVTYTATVTGPDEQVYTDIKMFNLATGEEITHKDHVWSEPVWSWEGTTSANGVAKATFTCSVSGNHTQTVNATVTEKSRKANKVVYVATVSSPAPEGKEYKDTCTVTWDENGEHLQPGKGDSEIPLVEGGDIIVVGINEDGYPFSNKKPIKPAFTLIDEARDGEVLALGKDYTVKYKNNKKVGTGIIEIKGKGNYQGTSSSVSFTIYDPVAKAKADGVELINGTVKKIAKISPVTYSGVAQYPEQIVVTLKDKSTVTMKHDGDGVYVNASEAADAKELVLTVTNNVNKGSAIVAVAAADGKVKTASFKINAADLSTAKVAEDMEATFAVKGTRPDKIVVTWTNGEDEEVELVEGQDFTVSLKNNKAAGTGKLVLKGKGNFAKKNESGSFKINELEVDDIAGVAAYEGVKAKAVKVTIFDGQGVALPAKALNVTVKNEEGTAVDPKTKLAAGKYTVVVTSKNANVKIDEAGIEREVTVGANLGKAKIDAKKLTVNYTGEPIELTDEQLASVTVTLKVNKVKKTLVAGEDFKVVGYTNNIKKGTMTVTIEGTGEETERGTFSGTKTFKVKIVAKNIDAKTK